MRLGAWFAVVSILAMGAAAGCGSSSKAAGSEGGPCYGNGSCNSGLTCFSKLCVEATGTGGAAGGASGGAAGGAAGKGGSGGANGSGGTAGAAGKGAGGSGAAGGGAGAAGSGAGGANACKPDTDSNMTCTCNSDSDCCNHDCYAGVCCPPENQEGAGAPCGVTGPGACTGAGGSGGAGGTGGTGGAGGAGPDCTGFTSPSQSCTDCVVMHCCAAAAACNGDTGCMQCVQQGGSLECVGADPAFAALSLCAGGGTCVCPF